MRSISLRVRWQFLWGVIVNLWWEICYINSFPEVNFDAKLFFSIFIFQRKIDANYVVLIISVRNIDAKLYVQYL